MWKSFYDELWFLKRSNNGRWTQYNGDKIVFTYSLVQVHMDSSGFFVVLLKQTDQFYFLKICEGVFYTSMGNFTFFEKKFYEGFWILEKPSILLLHFLTNIIY